LLHHDHVRGFIFDVNTGLLEEVFVNETPTGQLDPAVTPPPEGSARSVLADSVAADGGIAGH
jgi:hypothetical protein